MHVCQRVVNVWVGRGCGGGVVVVVVCVCVCVCVWGGGGVGMLIHRKQTQSRTNNIRRSAYRSTGAASPTCEDEGGVRGAGQLPHSGRVAAAV
jgi:hypothetical protein